MSDHDNYMQDLSDSHASRHDGGSIAVVLANPSSCAKRKEKGNGKKGGEVRRWRTGGCGEIPRQQNLEGGGEGKA
jgi:hypothetical protein